MLPRPASRHKKRGVHTPFFIYRAYVKDDAAGCRRCVEPQPLYYEQKRREYTLSEMRPARAQQFAAMRACGFVDGLRQQRASALLIEARVYVLMSVRYIRRPPYAECADDEARFAMFRANIA